MEERETKVAYDITLFDMMLTLYVFNAGFSTVITTIKINLLYERRNFRF